MYKLPSSILKFSIILLLSTTAISSIYCQSKKKLIPIKLSYSNPLKTENNYLIVNKLTRNSGSLITNIQTTDTNNLRIKQKKSSETKKYKLNPLRLTIVGAGMAGIWTAMHIYYSNTWWKDQRNYFKFAQDGYYARDMDKMSHIYTASAFTEITAVAYEWSGIPPKNALVYGAITTMAYETYIEINDGFAPIWGFDWVDMGANIFGVIYPFLQREIPILKNFNFKWSFKPGWIKKKTENADDLLDDYTNMTFWLSVSPEGLLPKNIAKYYPGFLGFAIGLSIKNASHTLGSKYAHREWILSLDYDITKLPGDTDFLKNLKKILNFYHFPAPAVRVSPSGVWYGLYF